MHEEKITTTELEVARPDYRGEILKLIRGNDTPRVMQQKLEDYHENDISEVIAELSDTERKKLFRVCSPETLSAVMEHLEDAQAGAYLAEMDLKKASKVIAELETDTAAAVLHELDKEKREMLIDSLAPDIKMEIRLIASFDEDEIGSKMTTNCIVIRHDLDIKGAMNELISQAKENDNISTIFVVDSSDEFYGAIDLKDLIIARKEEALDDLVVTTFPYVYANELVDDCIERLKDYSENSIPVLDNSNKLLGVITLQSVVEAVDDAMSEDYAKLAGLTAEEDLREPLLLSVKKRLPWLLALLGLGLVVSGVVGAFEKVVAQLTLIMAFQSLILDMAGNVGTQSLAVTIRVLMDEQLTARQKLTLVFKEMRVGFVNGIILGILSFVFVGLYICLIKHKELGFSYAVSGCIGFSLLLAMVVSSVVGTLIPIFFKRIGIDPAVASGPLITTVNDLVAVVTYYGMSWVLLINVFHFAG